MSNSEKKNHATLITGGSRGIGRAIAFTIAEKYAGTLFINYLQNDIEANKTREILETKNARCILVKANMAYPNEIDSLFDQMQSHIDHLDVFIHCAALNAFKPVTEIKQNQWDLTMNINSRSFLQCVQKCIPIMSEGKIVALSSLGSNRVIPNYGAMGPTKAALESLVRYFAVELAPKGINVNGISAGLIETESIHKFPNADSLISEAVARTPLHRIGTPNDVADVVMFLISSAARWINGQIIVADGGLSLA